MTLLEVIKAAVYAELEEVSHGNLWYGLHCTATSTVPVYIRFRIPFHETAGGTFVTRENNPKIFQRWIRKELEYQKEQEEMIAKAKEVWDREI